ncbi:uncharacterized protein LOC130612970 [Hydractinia symbiolongicarpus]|uniref:uncharacterized protein LOC130612970 n=1 Tax=Hydractinia symbiolongicarpus TaxID=13093 RepID=UPI00254C6FB3|nr:uncharacterized protein LOC130612970 [Hydractinia symbiolongicarpus]
MRQHSPCWISYITINIYYYRVYGINQQNRVVVTPGALPTNNSFSIYTLPWVREIKYRRNKLICGIGGDNSIYIWTGSSWTNYYVFAHSFDCAAKHILTIDLSTFELHLKEDNKASTKVATGAISRIQEYGKYWYAIGKDCKCIMRHETTPSPTVNKWEILTTNPGSSVEFKVAFNDIIYSLHEDQNIYEWYGNENRWIMIYQGPCIHFDVHHLIFCVTSNHEIHSNYGEYVPRPNIHIPFKTVNHVNKTTPYGRGMDMDGNTAVALDLEANNIALDQFGKGYVLQKGDGERVVFGNFEETALGGPFTNHDNFPTYFTISMWFRTTPQSTHTGAGLISTAIETGMYK